MKIVNSAAMGISDDDTRRKRKIGHKKEENSMWKAAGPDVIPEPKLCPKAIAEYPSIRNTRHHPLVDAVRGHLSYLGWRIEYLRFKGLFRYISPEGKLYVSLRQICQDLGSSTGEIGAEISQDDQKKPLLPSQGNSTGTGSSSPDYQEVSGSSPEEIEYYPEAVVYWYKNGLEKNRKCHLDMRLKARKHLFALGWLCTPLRRNTGLKTFRFRYTSPSGKNCNSLRTACKLCMDEGGLGQAQAIASTKNSSSSADSSFISRSRKRRRKHDSLQLQIEANSLPVEDEEEHHEDKRHRKETEILKTKRDDQKPTQSTPVLLSSKTARPEVQDISSPNLNPRTVLSWLIDNNVVVERAKVHYRGSEALSVLKKGRIGRDGINCDCCIKVFTLGGFEVHAGSKEKRPSANIILEDGRSLLECQRQVLRNIKARSSDRKEKDKVYSLQGNDQSDEICSVCYYGGDIILCDKCPSSFHHSCLGLKDVPEGEWVCSSCCCGICGKSKFEDTEYSTDDDIVRICEQCEHKFHMGCIRKRTGVVKLKDYSQNKWFCSDRCANVSSSLNELLGRPFPMGVDNLTWTLLKSMEEELQDANDSSEIEALVENKSKLNVALELMHECFEPVKEVLTGKDLVEDVIFNRRSNLNRLNFRGFYTVLLEKNEEIISVATIRVYEKVAKLPLIATRLQYRRHGICRLFMNAIERQLIELGVERLILPAVPGVLETWTTKFGFSKMTDNERLQFLDYTFLDFQDTTMCHKLLVKTPSAKVGAGVSSKQ
ncbi:hypothetical protein ACOSQ4_010660 [Xanthoceras sorbifolium]